ncbi:MAG: preprotein translocase subunit YajC [Chloroflexi bacterium]|nr:preprotein translocase subunit YajC [Chloroflexota bacterium]
MQVGDEVITYGGLIGTITELDDEIGVGKIRLAENLEVRILMAALQRPYDPEELARNIRLAQGIPEPLSDQSDQ